MKTLITVCARAGSKRLPGKHTKEYVRQPLFQYTIDDALKFIEQYDLDRKFIHVIVSSDDEAILEMSDDAEGKIHSYNRPEKLCYDDTPKMLAIRDAAREHSQVHFKTEEFWKIYSNVIDLDCCNPLRTSLDIASAFILHVSTGADCTVSAVNARRRPDFNQLVYADKTHYSIASDPSKVDAKFFDMNNSIHVYNSLFLRDHSSIAEAVAGKIYAMSDYTFCDIDTELDFNISEFLYKNHGYKY